MKALHLSLLLIHIAKSCRVFAPHEQKLFEAIYGKDIALNAMPYRVHTNTSKLYCSYFCGSDDKCNGFNYVERFSSECEYFNETLTSKEMRPGSTFFKRCTTGFPNTCLDYMEQGYVDSGPYMLDLIINKQMVTKRVYCDMKTDGGGWTLVVSRFDGREDFDRNWADYKHGFGDVTQEHYVGNDVIHAMTSLLEHTMRVDLVSFAGERRHAAYSMFAVASEAQMYTLNVEGYSGDAGDAFTYHNTMSFSTVDMDKAASSCAEDYQGGWWYNACSHAQLTGRWGPHSEQYDTSTDGSPELCNHGISWFEWWNSCNVHPKIAVMKIRPTFG